jgi:predicted HicB family RNase H-like nuclease
VRFQSFASSSFRAKTLAFTFANDKVSRCEHDDSECFTETALNHSASKEMQAQVLTGVNFAVATPNSKPTSLIPPAISPARESENYRVKQTGTRLTEAEFAEAEAAAAREGMSVSAWIREAILARLSAAQRVNTDPLLLAELMAIRALILNLFAAASKGPLTDESLRKMQAYADSVKQQKADEFLTKLRAGSGAKPPKGTP